MSSRVLGGPADEVVLNSGDPYEIHMDYYRRGWSDGLPVIPATPERVAAMMAHAPADWHGETRIPPAQGLATREMIAIQAVMAGCRPDQFPVVLAAVDAITDSAFNLTSMQATTHSVAPFIVVNGPRRSELDFNGGSDCLGPGAQGNATVGRALRLVLLNIGGGRPGVGDKASQGHPGKYTFCTAENEEENPWEPLHVARGFAPEDNTVTVFGAGAPVNINDHVGKTAFHILDCFADAMVSLAGNVMHRRAYGKNGKDQTGEFVVLFAPEHAQTIANEGWSKDDVRRYLFEHARIPTEFMHKTGMWQMHDAPRWMQLDRPGWAVPVVATPESYQVIVAGGAGKHSSVIPTHGSATLSTTVRF